MPGHESIDDDNMPFKMFVHLGDTQQLVYMRHVEL